MNDQKYAAETRSFMLATGATAVVTIVLGGVHGHGMATLGRNGAVDPDALRAILQQLVDQADTAITTDQYFDITITPIGDVQP
ncbi:hypothetical protein OKW45_001939 [Paraburkholderia sp. WSM4175]|uniref:hypothetical protein n=1 Tax=Paraburkholderia sp. WSM4175 TaxID=2991072 RepID=UPI003D1EA4C0